LLSHVAAHQQPAGAAGQSGPWPRPADPGSGQGRPAGSPTAFAAPRRDGAGGKGLDGVGISGTKPVLLGLSAEAIIDETPQWMTATGGKSVSGAGGPASSSTNLN